MLTLKIKKISVYPNWALFCPAGAPVSDLVQGPHCMVENLCPFVKEKHGKINVFAIFYTPGPVMPFCFTIYFIVLYQAECVHHKKCQRPQLVIYPHVRKLGSNHKDEGLQKWSIQNIKKSLNSLLHSKGPKLHRQMTRL